LIQRAGVTLVRCLDKFSDISHQHILVALFVTRYR
jgi:hypothetical protein